MGSEHVNIAHNAAIKFSQEGIPVIRK